MPFIISRVSIVLACWLFMAVSNAIDFWSGTATARAMGEPLMSHGFRRTVMKIGDYARLMIFALMFDALGCLLPFYSIPYATMLCTAAVICIEAKSVLENSRRKKAHAAEIPEIIKKIVQAATTQQGQKVLNEILKSNEKN